MDLVSGTDLRRELTARGTFAPSAAVQLIAKLLDALAAVHAIEVVHRDVKPENILLDTEGSPRLTDFGIARLTHGPTLTKLTGLIGTPEYLAPELAERDHATPAADVYSAGIVLYEMLTGFTPFSGGHPVAVLRRHLEEIAVQPKGLPTALWNEITPMLAKNPHERPIAAQASKRLQAIEPDIRGLPPMPASPPEHEDALPTSLKLKGIGRRADEKATVLKSTKTPGDNSRFTLSRKAIAIGAAALLALIAGLTALLVSGGSGPTPSVSYDSSRRVPKWPRAVDDLEIAGSRRERAALCHPYRQFFRVSRERINLRSDPQNTRTQRRHRPVRSVA